MWLTTMMPCMAWVVLITKKINLSFFMNKVQIYHVMGVVHTVGKGHNKNYKMMHAKRPECHGQQPYDQGTKHLGTCLS